MQIIRPSCLLILRRPLGIRRRDLCWGHRPLATATKCDGCAPHGKPPACGKLGLLNTGGYHFSSAHFRWFIFDFITANLKHKRPEMSGFDEGCAASKSPVRHPTGSPMPTFNRNLLCPYKLGGLRRGTLSSTPKELPPAALTAKAVSAYTACACRSLGTKFAIAPSALAKNGSRVRRDAPVPFQAQPKPAKSPSAKPTGSR